MVMKMRRKEKRTLINSTAIVNYVLEYQELC